MLDQTHVAHIPCYMSGPGKLRTILWSLVKWVPFKIDHTRTANNIFIITLALFHLYILIHTGTAVTKPQTVPPVRCTCKCASYLEAGWGSKGPMTHLQAKTVNHLTERCFTEDSKLFKSLLIKLAMRIWDLICCMVFDIEHEWSAYCSVLSLCIKYALHC